MLWRARSNRLILGTSSTRIWSCSASHCPTPETFKAIIALITSGRLKPLMERTYHLKDLALAQTEFVKRNHVGKFVIVP
ncbi:zinc-binding dehydrogenase [Mesorhizobium kowhaii]|uniref:zinc-binding dehydrogenase n=1 Tax=Mesorhizobium kowhaii TaxID=1300272 RepID=UPI0035EAF2BE